MKLSHIVTVSTKLGSQYGMLFPQPLPNLSAVLVGQHNGLVSSAHAAEICDQPKQEARAGLANWLQMFGHN